MSELADEFNSMRAVALAEQAARRQASESTHRRDSEMSYARRDTVVSQCRRMQLWEYAAWLTGFMKAGGKPTHFYDYATPLGNWFTALEDFTVLPLYGAMSVNIIVPAGIHLLGGDTGHSSLFVTTNGDDAGDRFLYQGFHDYRPHSSPRVVPVYTDTEVLA